MDIAENQCKKAGVDFVQKIVYGNPGYEIAKFANTSRNKIDMVVIGSRTKLCKRIILRKHFSICFTQIKTISANHKIVH